MLLVSKLKIFLNKFVFFSYATFDGSFARSAIFFPFRLFKKKN
jgi:hypothetical protein